MDLRKKLFNDLLPIREEFRQDLRELKPDAWRWDMAVEALDNYIWSCIDNALEKTASPSEKQEEWLEKHWPSIVTTAEECVRDKWAPHITEFATILEKSLPESFCVPFVLFWENKWEDAAIRLRQRLQELGYKLDYGPHHRSVMEAFLKTIGTDYSKRIFYDLCVTSTDETEARNKIENYWNSIMENFEETLKELPPPIEDRPTAAFDTIYRQIKSDINWAISQQWQVECRGLLPSHVGVAIADIPGKIRMELNELSDLVQIQIYREAMALFDQNPQISADEMLQKLKAKIGHYLQKCRDYQDQLRPPGVEPLKGAMLRKIFGCRPCRI